MSGKSKIEWTEKVWNAVTGCTKVSAGCKHCYAERMSKRLAGRAGYPADDPFKVTLHPDRLEEPLRWKKPSRIFVCSMSDLFHEDVPTDFIKMVLRVCAAAPQHTFIILTKRAKRLRQVMDGMRHCDAFGDSWARRMRKNQECRKILDTSPFIFTTTALRNNLWLGVTAENQETADERIPLLLRTPAAKRFVSIEPMLGPVDLYRWLPDFSADQDTSAAAIRRGEDNGLDWVICGGESGPGARPMQEEWARSLRDQCAAANVPFFFKQWGEWAAVTRKHAPKNNEGRLADGSTVNLYDAELRNAVTTVGEQEMVRIGKKNAGHLLDGKEHWGYPKVCKGEKP